MTPIQVSLTNVQHSGGPSGESLSEAAARDPERLLDCSHTLFEPRYRHDGPVESFVCVGGADDGPEVDRLGSEHPIHESIGTVVRSGHASPLGVDFEFLCRGLHGEAAAEVVHEVAGVGRRVERVQAMPSHGRVAVVRRDVTPLRDAQEGWRRTLEVLRVKLDLMLDPQVLLAPVRDDRGLVIDFTFTDLNAAACEYFGCSRAALRGVRYSVGRPGMSPGMIQRLSDVIDTGQPLVLDDVHFVNVVTGHDGWFDVRAGRVATGVSLTWREVTDRHATSSRLADSERLFRAVAGAASDVVALVSHDIRVRWWSPSVTRVLGRPPEEVLGAGPRELVHPDDLGAAHAHISAVLAGEHPGPMRVRMLRRDGTHLWMEGQLRPLEDESFGDVGYIAVLRDIDSVVKAEERLRETERLDRLTGLGTRAVALERIGEHLDRGSGELAILCVDVNGMAGINSARGYECGDIVLATVAERLVEAAGSADLVARIAGDEFAMLMPSVSNSGEAAYRATAVMEAVRRPVQVDSGPLDVTASVGVAMADEEPAEQVLSRATTAMRQAAASGPNRWQFLDESQNELATQRLLARAGLRRAITDGQLQPWFMPVVSLDTGQTVGYEALVRWHGPDGVVTPDRFLPVAESMGLAPAVDRAVFTQIVLLMTDALRDCAVGLNVTGHTLNEDGFADWVVASLSAAGVDPVRLHIEVTEVGLVNVTETVLSNLGAFRESGMGVWLDDFGTGFSSISHLRHLPITGMKLDKSFAVGVADSSSADFALARGLLDLATAFGLDTVAEGIETVEQAAALRAMGWTHGQGYLFGRPEPAR